MHLRLGGDGAGVGELAVELDVELGAVGDHHERPRARERRSTFWVNHSIDRLLPEPCVCQNTPSRFSPAARDPEQVLDRRVDAEELVVAGHHLDQPTGALDVGDEVLDQVEQPVVGRRCPGCAVSSATTPRVPSASMTFQSPKNSHGAYVEPTLASDPFETDHEPVRDEQLRDRVAVVGEVLVEAPP